MRFQQAERISRLPGGVLTNFQGAGAGVPEQPVQRAVLILAGDRHDVYRAGRLYEASSTRSPSCRPALRPGIGALLALILSARPDDQS